MSIASASPRMRARDCCARGSFPERIAMKMMLSIPRTSSSAVRVTSAIQVFGSASAAANCAAPGWNAARNVHDRTRKYP
jgi:hypothetical protein